MKRDYSYVVIWGAIFVFVILAVNAIVVEYNFVAEHNKGEKNVLERKKFDTDNVSYDGTADR
jgi:hypothetical protein